MTSEYDPTADNIDVGETDENDKVARKRLLTNEVGRFYLLERGETLLPL